MRGSASSRGTSTYHIHLPSFPRFLFFLALLVLRGYKRGRANDASVVSYYLPQLASNVGITSTDTKLILNIGYAVEGYLFASAGARLHDVFGRRKMLLCATAGLIVSLAIAAGTAAGYVSTGSKTSSSASIGFIFVFGAVFAFGFTAMQPIYPAEVMANDMRAKGMGTYKIVGGAAGFVNTFAAPIALSKVSWRFLSSKLGGEGRVMC